MQRRDFLQLAALGGGAVSIAGLAGCAHRAEAKQDEFYFVQLSDIHWGFSGAPNPDARGTLPKAVAAVNALPEPPDFIVFTGDLTHTTDNPDERRRRMLEFKQQIAPLKTQTLRFMPGEHDAALDRGAIFKELFGPTYYRFDHKGVHFMALDNVSDRGTSLGAEQLDWMKAELAKLDPQAPLVVFAHRPLFPLVPRWDWHTRDGAEALALLEPHQHVTVFYGHIHQEHHQQTGRIAHHSARSLMFPLPAPGTAEKPAPLPWDPAAPYRGLGWRGIEQEPDGRSQLAEHPIAGGASA
ncbi:metallophosphoesterase [Pelomonas sp. KK5]|uniref:metallophosphoesterase family protein n=1 Tax=Pelomonas sp. KK5 TaxID=1855730 RepID=UPI00097C8A7C|nr:metallophosphoesterase [Pelomonas sp. KK5]